MIPISVIALFCEDIREEKNDAVTIIGIMPDKMEARPIQDGPVDGTPVMPKLCIYSRLHFDPNEDIGVVDCKLLFPNGEERALDIFDDVSVREARTGAKKNGAPIAGVFSRLTIPNFPILAEGRIQLIVTIKGASYVAGALEMKIIRSSTTAT